MERAAARGWWESSRKSPQPGNLHCPPSAQVHGHPGKCSPAREGGWGMRITAPALVLPREAPSSDPCMGGRQDPITRLWGGLLPDFASMLRVT
uniref:Uncharacterized protein n=1 Tax=Gopherus evgoodei TaxID=1825980 RepID=A0A8C4W1Z6_9SAUR